MAARVPRYGTPAARPDNRRTAPELNPEPAAADNSESVAVSVPKVEENLLLPDGEVVAQPGHRVRRQRNQPAAAADGVHRRAARNTMRQHDQKHRTGVIVTRIRSDSVRFAFCFNYYHPHMAHMGVPKRTFAVANAVNNATKLPDGCCTVTPVSCYNQGRNLHRQEAAQMSRDAYELLALGDALRLCRG